MNQLQTSIRLPQLNERKGQHTEDDSLSIYNINFLFSFMDGFNFVYLFIYFEDFFMNIWLLEGGLRIFLRGK